MVGLMVVAAHTLPTIYSPLFACTLIQKKNTRTGVSPVNCLTTKKNKTGETPYMNARFAIFCVRGMSQILKPFVEQ